MITLTNITNWNGKTYNNAIYLAGNKVTNKTVIAKTKAFHTILSNFREAIAEQKHLYSDQVYYKVAGKADQIVFNALQNGDLIYTNLDVISLLGYQFCIYYMDDLAREENK